jgi:hypothetical protein
MSESDTYLIAMSAFQTQVVFGEGKTVLKIKNLGAELPRQLLQLHGPRS